MIKITAKKAASWLVQLILGIVVFVGVSQYLAKDMLSVRQQVPALSTERYAQLAGPNESVTDIKPWSDAKQHLVYFFAPWCTVCALSQPSLKAFKAAKPSTQVIMVALDWPTIESVAEFKQKHQFDFPVILGDTALKQQWKVDAYPSYYFVNERGEVTSKDRGLVTLPGLFARSL